eukprot:TRINITY_DN3940_c0_g1_i1.p1 TRINITY_DN3940_c0_g1~~TRINITY_DN3940_c0_g1_i1.p1  ORF type:complete len:265 (+),score=45.71 TRINITY_DN3940_c0_g1_i1:2-796(+)
MFMRSRLAFLFFIVGIEAGSRGLPWLGWNNPGVSISTFKQGASKIQWLYNWERTPPADIGDLEFVPMQWGKEGIEQLGTIVRNQRAKRVLSFNEPDLASQSNLSPQEAAQLFKQYFMPLRAEGIQVSAPAVSNGPTGIPWLREFFAACQGCQVDFIPLHYYGPGLTNFYYYLNTFHLAFQDRCGAFWITEYADTNWSPSSPLPTSEVVSFMEATLPRLDSFPWLHRYSWYGPFRNIGSVGEGASLVNPSNGALSQLGEVYVYAA